MRTARISHWVPVPRPNKQLSFFLSLFFSPSLPVSLSLSVALCLFLPLSASLCFSLCLSAAGLLSAPASVTVSPSLSLALPLHLWSRQMAATDSKQIDKPCGLPLHVCRTGPECETRTADPRTRSPARHACPVTGGGHRGDRAPGSGPVGHRLLAGVGLGVGVQHQPRRPPGRTIRSMVCGTQGPPQARDRGPPQASDDMICGARHAVGNITDH